MAKREFSAGGIVFRKKSKALEVLLIKDTYGRWSWPKGKIEQGESSADAAVREVKEEVGLSNLRILGRAGRSNYFYRLKGDLVFKTVFFFLLEVNNLERLQVQKEEIADARWFRPDQALDQLGYKGAKEMLQKATAMYKEANKC
jgi:8-oxo-dGTP pyrophosphatase MutT (NUDIX family)